MVKFEDGRSGVVAADLKISDAKVFMPVGRGGMSTKRSATSSSK